MHLVHVRVIFHSTFPGAESKGKLAAALPKKIAPIPPLLPFFVADALRTRIAQSLQKYLPDISELPAENGSELTLAPPYRLTRLEWETIRRDENLQSWSRDSPLAFLDFEASILDDQTYSQLIPLRDPHKKDNDVSLPLTRIPTFSLYNLFSKTIGVCSSDRLGPADGKVKRPLLELQDPAEYKGQVERAQMDFENLQTRFKTHAISTGDEEDLSQVYALPRDQKVLAQPFVSLWRWRMWCGEGWQAGRHWRELRGGI